MANVFEILLNSQKRNSKPSEEKLNSLLGDREEDFYKEKNEDEEKESSENESKGIDDLDIVIGEEKDKVNHLKEYEKLSMRSLDKKNQKEQLKTLKLEYNKVYDKLLHLNELLGDNEKTINDLIMETREDKERIAGFRSMFRDFINMLPGSPELKDIVNEGSWRREQVKPYLEEAMNRIIQHYKNVDLKIEDAVGYYQNEAEKHKKEAEKYKGMALQALELEEVVEKLVKGENVQTKKAFDSSNKISETLQEDMNKDTKTNSSFFKTDDSLDSTKNKESEIDEDKSTGNTKGKSEDDKFRTSEHKVQFKNFFDENKQEDQENSDRKSKNLGDEHPLSPDYIETEKEEVSELFDDNLKSYINDISDNQEFIIRIIGETGISRNPDLRDYLQNHKKGFELYKKGTKIDYQSLSADVSVLREKQVLKEEKLNLGGKGGGGSVIIYELSKIGKQAYKFLFKEDPVIPEKKRLLDLHASLEHGYMIKDSSTIFTELGYKVYTELSDVTIRTGDGTEKKVFDFIIENNEGKIKYIEVERGTHNKEDFFHAMDKIYKITKDFYFICPSDAVKNKKTKQMFFSWITERLGGIKNADVVLNMTTITQLKKKPKNIWETTDLRNIK